MAVQVVACPGCQSTLKAPENMAGKKAKCKKCGASFRIPGGAAPSGDSVSEGQMLSAMDVPMPAGKSSPFDFAAPASQKQLPRPAAKAPPPPEPNKPKDDVPAALPVDDETPPAADPLSFDDDDEVPTVAPGASGDPFTFGSAPSAPAKSKSKASRAPSGAGLEPETVAKRGEYRTKNGGSSSKLILAAVVFALIVVAGIGGVLIYLNSKKEPEPVAIEKKEDKKLEPTPTVEPTPTPKVENKGPTPPTTKGNEKAIPKKEPGGKKPVGSSGQMLGLPPGRTITFAPVAAKPANMQEPSNRLAIVPVLPGKADASFAMARKVFPPLKRDIDIGVIWQTEAGFQNRGEKLLLGIYSPQTGKQANQVAFEGDGSAEPACDLSVSADLFAHAHATDGKITVWNTRDGSKAIDGFSPYADKKDLKLAAVYLTEPPDAMIAVSTTGVVRAFRVPTKEQLGEFIPSKTSSKPLAAGKNIAPGPDRQSVILAVGGTVYSVSVKSSVSGQVVAEIGGDVGRSFGLAVSGSGKLLYAFETDSDNKKEKAVMRVRPDGSHVFHRWPEKEAGEPAVVGWVDDDLAMVGTDRGACVWFEAKENDFRPIGLAKTPGDKARHVASDGHWSLLPDPADPKKCVLVEYSRPQEFIVEVLENAKQPPTVLLSDKGLQK